MSLASLRNYRVASVAGTREQGTGRKEGRSARKQAIGSCRALKAPGKAWLLHWVRYGHLKDCEQQRDMIKPRLFFIGSLWLLRDNRRWSSTVQWKYNVSHMHYLKFSNGHIKKVKKQVKY